MSYLDRSEIVSVYLKLCGVVEENLEFTHMPKMAQFLRFQFFGEGSIQGSGDMINRTAIEDSPILSNVGCSHLHLSIFFFWQC